MPIYQNMRNMPGGYLGIDNYSQIFKKLEATGTYADSEKSMWLGGGDGSALVLPNGWIASGMRTGITITNIMDAGNWARMELFAVNSPAFGGVRQAGLVLDSYEYTGEHQVAPILYKAGSWLYADYTNIDGNEELVSYNKYGKYSFYPDDATTTDIIFQDYAEAPVEDMVKISRIGANNFTLYVKVANVWTAVSLSGHTHLKADITDFGTYLPTTAPVITDNSYIRVGQSCYVSSGGDYVHIANKIWYNGAAWVRAQAGAGCLLQLSGDTFRFYTHDATEAPVFVEQYTITNAGTPKIYGTLTITDAINAGATVTKTYDIGAGYHHGVGWVMMNAGGAVGNGGTIFFDNDSTKSHSIICSATQYLQYHRMISSYLAKSGSITGDNNIELEDMYINGNNLTVVYHNVGAGNLTLNQRIYYEEWK
jgi:hypothetical protein